MSASSQGDALFHELERLRREIAQQVRSTPDAEAIPAHRLKLGAMMDDLDRLLGELKLQRDALKREITGVDGAMAATGAYQTSSRLGQTK